MPVSIIALLLTKKLPLVSGLLFISLGTSTIVLGILYKVWHPGYVAGLGIGYNVIFVSLPLIFSGVIFSYLGISHQKRLNK
jgi:hypothetical protein